MVSIRQQSLSQFENIQSVFGQYVKNFCTSNHVHIKAMLLSDMIIINEWSGEPNESSLRISNTFFKLIKSFRYMSEKKANRSMVELPILREFDTSSNGIGHDMEILLNVIKNNHKPKQLISETDKLMRSCDMIVEEENVLDIGPVVKYSTIVCNNSNSGSAAYTYGWDDPKEDILVYRNIDDDEGNSRDYDIYDDDDDDGGGDDEVDNNNNNNDDHPISVDDSMSGYKDGLYYVSNGTQKKKKTKLRVEMMKFSGANLIEPKLGFHLNPIEVLDFTSQYPTGADEMNMGKETGMTYYYIQQHPILVIGVDYKFSNTRRVDDMIDVGEYEKLGMTDYIANNYRFFLHEKRARSVFMLGYSNEINIRIAIKKTLPTIENDVEREQMTSKCNAYKILINSKYGLLPIIISPLYIMCITSIGRRSI